MLDIKWIRDNQDAFVKGLTDRGFEASAGATLNRILSLDEQRRAAIQKLQEAQARRNAASKEVGQAKAKKDEAGAKRLMDEVAAFKTSIQEGEAVETRFLETSVLDLLAAIPNTPAADVPVGVDAEANVELRKFGEPKKFSFQPKQHFEIGEALGLMDFETAAKLSGARFVVLKGALAKLERALAQFMLDLHTSEHGYTEIAPPLLVRDDTMFGTAQLPKFEVDQFAAIRKLTEKESEAREGQFEELKKGLSRAATPFLRSGFDAVWESMTKLWLIPTAEVPLTNLVREEIVDEAKLPMRVTAGTPCFRAEAGAAGKDTRGMIRQHQFNKVELVSITTPEQSAEEHERMTKCAETVSAKARASLSRDGALDRRHGLRRAEDLRHRGVAAGAGDVSRDLLLLELRGLPGPPHERALQAERRQGNALRPHAERLGRRRRPRADRRAGELSRG